ncbi:MAG: YciI family protein [Bacteroidota bacterium]
MEFLLIAYDGADEAALDRRMSVREKHLAYARGLYKEGRLLKGGALLNEEGKMIGSAAIYQAESTEELQKTIDEDPYTINGVWVNVTIQPFRLANLD